MHASLRGLPRWVLAELAAGAHPEVAAPGASVRWERDEDQRTIAYLFYVNGETYVVDWLKKRGPEPG